MLKKLVFKSYTGWTQWTVTTSFICSCYAYLQLNALRHDALRDAVGTIPCALFLLLAASLYAKRKVLSQSVNLCLAGAAWLAMLGTSALIFYSVHELATFELLRFAIGQSICTFFAASGAIDIGLISLKRQRDRPCAQDASVRES